MAQTDYDLVIIGAGPAGLTAAIYAARARLKVLLLEKAGAGGQILVSDMVENYPGFPGGITGAELMMKFIEQAESFGVSPVSEEVVEIDCKAAPKVVVTEKNKYRTHALIIATGASPRKLGVPGEDTFFGRGVSLCATCDAPFFRDKVVVAVGGGDTAVQESLFLSRFASKVYLVHRRDELRASKILQERILAEKKVEIVWDSVVEEIKGDQSGVTAVTVRNVKTGEIKDIAAHGCFVWIGVEPNSQLVSGSVKTDSVGYILVDSCMQTSVPGVFAAGDVRDTPLRQVSTAVGDGAIAATQAAHYIENMERTRGS